MKKTNSFKKDFVNPDKTFRPAPFWFWNHRLDDEELKWQIREMKRKGVGGFVMHARHGLITPYMSEEWLRCIGTAVKEAEKVGMWAWLYDEYNWPSGMAGGRIAEEYPEYRMSQFYVAREIDLAGPLRWRKNLKIKDEIKFIYAARIEGGRIKGVPQGVIDLSGNVKDGEIEWDVPDGRWKVVVIARNVSAGTFFGYYLDLLNKDAVKKFIEYTHKVYVERFGRYMGRVIPGTFFDEPGMQYTVVKRSIPWTEDIPRRFRRDHGYDLGMYILGLFYDIGTKTGKVRCDYYEAATGLYVEAFFKQIYDYCKKNNLLSIGHVVHEGELFDSVKHQGDFFRTAEHMHWGGVDSVGHQIFPDDPHMAFGLSGLCNFISSKMASSSAHLCGKPRVMSEAFGVVDGWKLNLRTLKLLADWQVILGVNYFIPHAFYYSIEGFRKWECAPDEFYRTTYWRYYKVFADYLARLCCLFTGCRHVADTAVLYPVRSIWAERDPDPTPVTLRMQKDFENLSAFLMKLHRDFDYVTEEMIQNSEIKNGEMRVKHGNGKSGETFRLLVLPSVTTLSRKTLKNVKMFCEKGGYLLIINHIPGKSMESGEDYIVSEFFRELIKEKDNVVYLNLNRTNSGKTMNELANALGKMTEPDVTIGCSSGNAGEVVCCHYQRPRAGEDIYFFSNTSDEKRCRADIAIRAKGVLKRVDAVSGKTTDFRGYREVNGKIHLKLEFEPTQSHLILVSREGKSRLVASPEESFRRVKSIDLSDEWNFRTEKMNAFPITEWKLKMKGTEWWGIRTFQSEVFVKKIPGDAKLIIDGLLTDQTQNPYATKPVEVRINGKKVIYVKGQQNAGFKKSGYINHHFWEVDIQKCLKQGKNEIIVETHGGAFEPAHIGEIVVIIGSFSLSKNRGNFLIDREKDGIRTGSWCEQGYPFYSGTGIYEQEVNIGNLGRQHILCLDKVADLADIWVNGRQVAVLPWEPFRADVTGYLSRGKNKITIKVVNSLQNFLHKDAHPSGLLKGVRIIIKS